MNFKAIVFAATLALGGAAIAQTGTKTGQSGPPKTGAQRGGPQGQMRVRMTAEQRAERFAKQLNLTAAQKTKVVAIYKATDAQGKKIFEDKKMTREQKMKAFEKFRDENRKKINAILTKDQQKKYAEMRTRPRGMTLPGAPGVKGGPPPKKGTTGTTKSGTTKSGKSGL